MIRKMENGYESIALFCLFLGVFLFLILSNNAYADDFDMNKIESKSVVVMEGAGKNIILEKNAHEKVNPASITKIMTLLLIYETISEGKIKESGL